MPHGVRFMRLHRAFRRQTDEAVKEFDITGAQFGVLAQLWRLNRKGEENVNQTMLEEAQGLLAAQPEEE